MKAADRVGAWDMAGTLSAAARPVNGDLASPAALP
jgi:hypothetical protein